MSLHDSITRLKGRGITGDKIDEYRAAWELFDTDGSGTVTTGKLGSLLNDTFGCSYSGEDLTYMLSQFGSSSEGRVDFFAFASTLHDRIGDPRYSEAWGDAFDLLDTSKMGELSKDDLQAGMLKLGETLTDAEADEMLKIAKKKDDFVRAMSNAVAATSSSAGGAGGAAPAVASGAAPTPGAGPVATPGRPGKDPTTNATTHDSLLTGVHQLDSVVCGGTLVRSAIVTSL